MYGLHVSILPFITILAGDREFQFIIGKGGLRPAGCRINAEALLFSFRASQVNDKSITG
jgi:hypothetical protein